jgi:hypothetical protein
MSRYDVAYKPEGANGSTRLRVTVTDTTTGTVQDPVEVTRETIREAARRLAALMEGARVEDVERELAAAIDQSLAPELLVRPARELCEKFPELKPEIIEGLLRESETANIIAVSKRGKTFLALYIALSIASGRCIFGRHAVRRAGPVLYIDAELHPNTLAKRIATVARAMGLTSDEYADALHVVSLRGNLCDLYALKPRLFSRLQRGQYVAVFLDALYRLVPSGVDENSNSDMTPLYNMIDNTADEMGAAILLIHHASKGNQSGKSVTDTGAGAGAISRATDSHIILRDHEEDDVVVMEAACRSFPPLEPVCLKWEYPLWKAAPELDPTQLRQDGRKRRKAEPPPEPEYDAQRFVAEFVTGMPVPKSLIITKAAKKLGSSRQATGLLQMAEAEGLVHRWQMNTDKRVVYYANREQQLYAE